MVLKALEAKRKGAEPRFGPKGFPEVDFGEELHVPTPGQGGDGTAIDDYREKLRSGMQLLGGHDDDPRGERCGRSEAGGADHRS